VLAVGLVGVFALALSPQAFAHAALIETNPSAGEALARSPARVVLRFDETVSTVAGSVRVFDGEANRVDTGDVDKPSNDSVSVALPSNLPHDTYTVAWRVLSADSHPVRGAFVFSVGEPPGKGVAEQVLDAEASSSAVDGALAVTRFAGLALILLSVGGVAVLATVAERQDGRSAGLWLVVCAGAALLILDTLAWIALTGVKAAGFGLGDVHRWALSRDVLETSFGKVWVVRVLLALALAIVAVLLRRRRTDALLGSAVFLASAIAVTPALSGHARVEGTLAILSDSVHVLAAGVWAGGLAFLALMLAVAGGDRWSLARTVVPRFSTLAVLSVGALAASGVISAILEVRSWSALWETTYGQLVLVKVALLLPLLALGAYNNRVSVPRLRTGSPGSAARPHFVRAVAAELALLVVVVGVTTALIAEPPAKAQAAVTAVSRDGTVGPYDYTFVVDPARTGTNEIHVYLLDSTGALAPVDEIDVSASLPAVDIGPLELDATRAGPGHAIVTAADLPLAGTWRFEIDVRKGEFDQWSTSIDIPIRKD
jgi:copper transport protein